MTKLTRPIGRPKYQVESSGIGLPIDSIFDETNAFRTEACGDQTEALTRARRKNSRPPSGSPASSSLSLSPEAKRSIWSRLFGKGDPA